MTNILTTGKARFKELSIFGVVDKIDGTGEAMPQPIRVGGVLKKGIVEADRNTLRRLIMRALKDALPMIESDPYLIRKLALAEGEDDPGKAYSSIDARVARAVKFHLDNRAPNERVRGASITCMSEADLTTRGARCIIKVRAWGHEVRECLDLKIPTENDQ